MSILGIDLGTKCGWAVKKTDGTIFSGCLDSTPLPKTKKRELEHPGLRYRKFHWLLLELNQIYGDLTGIAYENVMRHTSTASSHVYGGYRAILDMFAHSINVIPSPYGVGVCKLESVGMGKASKEATLLFANKWTGRLIESEDEGDALCVLYTHLKLTEQL
jgi:crossover junction endodeoxyribonuclease RuvC